ncbi:P-loop containing nucleoside triphosphate hydrolase protein [Lentinula aciculospora]|uniref:P-loop containing nucleoside triphosphate hydrolase protein n=1 Tax=Lentinula aciculospora TaxID=153920 RepID=A0A9W9DKQ7_9AGAR|nr:P-loop containing nucleoside triphosphate hydrolase protein [Lentinula aciculospora]
MSAAVRIVARLRPPLPGEVCDDGVRVVSHHSSAADSNKENTESKIVPAKTNLGPGILVLKDPSSSSLTQQSQHYPFHSAYCPEKWLSSPINPDSDSASTKSLFIHDVLPLVDQVLSGATVTVFAYGVTSSGKTYTMQGNGGDEDRGIIGMVVQELFKRLDESTSSLSMSYLELYLDTPFDLLVPPTQRRRLQILSTSSAGTTSSHSGPPLLSFGTSIHLPNLSTHPVDSPEAFQVLYADAMRHRSTGATLLNSESSRSHAVLTLYVTTTSEQNNVGKLHLLDLAGSENNNLTGNNPERMKESSAINKSLTALGQVVNALNDNAKIVARAAKQANIASAEPPKLKRIPYRSSSLTRLLSDALGGTSLALLIVCLAPGTKFRSDLVRSVGFASQARRIENKTLPPPPPPAQPIKVPTSKTFDFAIPFRPSSGSSSNSNSSNSNTITFTSSSDKAKFPSSTNLSSDTSAFSRPRSPPARPIRPARSTRSARPRASSISRDARKVINKNNLLLSPLKSTTSKRRTRRISFIPVPQGSGSRGSLGRGSQRGGSGKLSMILEGLPRPRASAGGRLENPSEHSLSGDGSVGAGYAGSGSGSGSGVVMTEEEIQERVSFWVFFSLYFSLFLSLAYIFSSSST